MTQTINQQNKHPFVRKPSMRNGEWCVVIADGISPLSEELELVPCGKSKENAFQAYRRIKKEQGKMI